MELIQFMTVQCSSLAPIIKFIKGILSIIQIGVPVILIIMGAIDLGKAVMSSDDKEIKGATGKLIKRAIAAVAVFFLVTFVTLVMGLVQTSGGAGTGANFVDCWNKV